jgi:hypothetical protein
MASLTRFLTVLLAGLAAVTALAVVVSLLLPGSAEAERSITVAATPATVFTLLDGFTRFAEWSPSHDLDPAPASTLDGPEHGVGAAIAAYMAVHDLEAAGPRWEQYVSDPGTTPAAELITRVCVPVR